MPIVQLEMLIVRPMLIVVVAKIIFAPEPAIPTVPSSTNVPPDVVIRYHVAVPAADPVNPEGTVGVKLTVPPNVPVAAGAKGVPRVPAASSVVTAPPVAGRVPSYNLIMPALPTADVFASPLALRNASE